MRRFAVFVGVALLSLSALVGAASATSVTVGEQGDTIIIEVTDNGRPVEGADVTVSGVQRKTPLDGEYVTDSEGQVVIGEERVKQVTGIVHLRVSVDTGDEFRSVLSTITRGAKVGPAPLGQRISMGLHKSASRTRGKVEGRMYVSTVDPGNVTAIASQVDTLLRMLSDARFKREVIQRDFAAGDISPSEFYLRAVANAGRSAALRAALGEVTGYLDGYRSVVLRENGVDVENLAVLRAELENDRLVDTNRRLVGEQ